MYSEDKHCEEWMDGYVFHCFRNELFYNAS